MWMNQNFLLQDDIVVEGNSLNINFLSLRGTGAVIIKMEQAGQVKCHYDLQCGMLYTTNPTDC